MRQAEALSTEQIAFYHEQGYLLLENWLDDAVIEQVRDEIARLTAPASEMTESDDRLDLEDSHHPDNPRVRRIKLPHKQSSVLDELMRSDRILAPKSIKENTR